MANENDKQKKKVNTQFTILSQDSTDGHGGFGVGTISLNDVSPVIVDPQEEEAYVDMGALHAKSKVEKRIKFLKDKSEVENGQLFWLVWVTVGHQPGGQAYYTGVAACEMIIDFEIRRGYKNLADHVNKMDKSMKRHVIVDHMDAKSKKLLANFLQAHNEQMWNNSSAELKAGLQTD